MQTKLQIPPSVSTIKLSGRTQSFVGLHWLAEFGDVSCLQFNYLRVETLTPTWEDLVGHLSDNFKSEVRQNSVSDLSVCSLIHLAVSFFPLFHRNQCSIIFNSFLKLIIDQESWKKIHFVVPGKSVPLTHIYMTACFPCLVQALQ
jgi:hypothetical protein